MIATGDGTVLPRLPTLWALFVKAGGSPNAVGPQEDVGPTEFELSELTAESRAFFVHMPDASPCPGNHIRDALLSAILGLSQRFLGCQSGPGEAPSDLLLALWWSLLALSMPSVVQRLPLRWRASRSVERIF